uniref:ubiquitinyl hydrolase 1 n=1 Tax=Bionectria ochroleuca TaxID=29856 RepID=A0A0B7KQE7_BIOOC
MFQPQPTPFASACFASTPYAFPSPPQPVSNPPQPSRATALSYGLLGQRLDLGFHIPSSGGPAHSSIAGTTAGAAPGLGATGIGAAPGVPSRGLAYSSPQPLGHSRPPPHQQQQHIVSHRHQPPVLIKMEDSDPHGIAAQQAAAKDYQPNLEGPLVGEKTTTSIITQEYEKADASFVEKTYNLPQTFQHYRPIQGDGNCGWRAIGFSYYEKLIEIGNRSQVESELARLRGLNQMLPSAGYQYWEDFADEALTLLQDVADNIGNPSIAHQLIFQRWNEDGATQSIIYYFRMLAGMFLKMHDATYDPFIADAGGIPGYCSSTVDIPNKEIEHLGITALVDVLLKPINVVLEILYLDRSPGPHATKYRFPEEANEQDESQFGAIIYLLFRPTHYDILYRAPPLPVEVPQHPVSIQVHRVNTYDNGGGIMSTQTDLGAFATGDFSMLSMLPGFAPPSGPSQPPWAQQYCDGLTTPSPQSTTQQPPVVAPAPPSLPKSSTPLSPRTTATAGVTRPAIMAAPTSLVPPSPECTIRFSPMQLEYDGSKGSYPEPTFQVTTSTFKNSVWNRAHFGNPDFHPEEWSPDDENVDGRMGSRKKSK